MIEIRKAQRVAKEEHRRIVAYHVPIALFGVELQGETADVALSIRSAALAGDRGKTREQWRLLADFGEDFRFGMATDVMRDSEGPMRTGTFGVHAPLGNHFAVKVCEFFDQPDVLQQGRAARAGGLDVEIVADRRTRRMSQVLRGEILFHSAAPRFFVNGW